jgi:hypothetical protein
MSNKVAFGRYITTNIKTSSVPADLEQRFTEIPTRPEESKVASL